MPESGRLSFHPVTPDRWADLEALFGPSGAYSGCWCMWWRLKRREFDSQSGEEKRRGLKSIVDSGESPGLLAYADGRPVGWCSVVPRERLGALERSRTFKRVDDRPVWSIVCFYVAKPFRGRGAMAELVGAAVDYAREHGAMIVEGYPVEPKGALSGYSGYMGVESTFLNAGFVEVARTPRGRPVMRYYVERGAGR